MNVLQILPELNVGGVETGTLDLARHLVKNGHKAVVVSSGGTLVGELEGMGARHYQLPVSKKSIFTVLSQVRPLCDIISKEDIGIVHARSRVPAWIAYLACRRSEAVFITTCHGYYSRHIFSFVMGWGKLVIAISNIIARHMIDDFAVLPERIRLVHRGVDLERFKFISPEQKRKGDFNIGIIGRLTPIKGHLDFIKAMAIVARSLPRLKIWIVGDAPASRQAYKDEIQVLVRRLGLSHCTEFLGAQRDIPAIMTHLDLLVLATKTHEAFGRVILEAQASGVPVVATEVGGVIDIIDNGKNGLLVPAQDPKSIAEAALKIYKDTKLASSLAEAAYMKAKEKFNNELMSSNTLEVYRQALNNFRILVIKFGSLGDVILISASLRALREKFGSSYKITLLVSDSAKEAVLRCPYIDELLVVDFKNKDKGLKGLLRLGRLLARRGFDLVVDLQNNRKSHILSFLSLSARRYGYDRKLGFLLNHKVKDDLAPMDPVRHQFRVLKMLGIELKDPRLELWFGPEDERRVDELLSGLWLAANQKLIGINLSASRRWASKSWPIEHISSLCEELGEQDYRVILTGDPSDSAEAEKIANSVKATRLVNTCGKTSINELACLIKRCNVYISADSSPMHIASAVDVPFVALFGPTDPARHVPSAEKCAVINKKLDCSPCYKPRCRRKRCMELISVQEVLEAVQRLA